VSDDLLAGIRVLDFSHALAGPHCSRHLADLGADVIKVESPGLGDYTRTIPMVLGPQTSTYFANQNAGKRSICLDLTHEDGRRVARELAVASDVVLENFRPGVLARFGLDYESLRPLNPRLIMCSISAFGQTGPLANLPGFAYTAAAFSGVMSLDVERDGWPHVSHVPFPDYLAGLYALAAIGLALFERERTGRGQAVDIALTECALVTEDLAAQHAINGGRWTPQRRPGVSVHRVGDGFVVIMVTHDEMFGRLADAMGRPDLKADPRFVPRPVRMKNQGELDRLVDAWLKAFPSRQAALAHLEQFRVPCAPILTTEEALAHEQVAGRGLVAETGDGVRVFRSPLRFSRSPVIPRGPAPATIGADTRAVLARVLGYDEARIEALERSGAVHQG